MNNRYISFDILERFVREIFVRSGVPEDDAAIATDVLLQADKLGIDSHGVNRLKLIYLDRLKEGIQSPVTNFEIIREGHTTAVVDGHHGMGQVIGYRSMQLAIDKAKQYGMG
ncbi:MAG: Ldh family oxidoreductase, partial [Bacteroidales bacterium]|nr:Ldh family oxidoreductase [Bacteroidales bacterium]